MLAQVRELMGATVEDDGQHPAQDPTVTCLNWPPESGHQWAADLSQIPTVGRRKCLGILL